MDEEESYVVKFEAPAIESSGSHGGTTLLQRNGGETKRRVGEKGEMVRK